jgi:erythromycin esterase
VRFTPLGLFLALGTLPLGAQSDPGRDAFLTWARGALKPIASAAPIASTADLAPLKAMIGNATVVTISEAVHGGAEPLEFRNRLFQFLVQEMGFTAIAIESGISESRQVHDYVRGGPGELKDALARGITWTMDKLPQNAALVSWIREYNADPKHTRKINFYGFDVPGSPANPQASRGLHTGLEEALLYLDRVDATAARALHARVDKWIPRIKLNPASSDSAEYGSLTQAERDELGGIINDMVVLYERREAAYVAASTRRDYQWAYRSALGARVIDQWLRQMPVGWKASEGMTFFGVAIDVRDRSQADNVSWIVEQEGAGGKVLVFAHRYHTSSSPVTTPISPPGGNAVMGTYLRPRLGSKLLNIGNLIGTGTWGCTGWSEFVDLKEAPAESIDRIAQGLGQKLWMLDLRAAPGPVKAWIDREHPMGQGQEIMRLNLAKAYDLFFYLDRVTPACP